MGSMWTRNPEEQMLASRRAQVLAGDSSEGTNVVQGNLGAAAQGGFGFCLLRALMISGRAVFVL